MMITHLYGEAVTGDDYASVCVLAKNFVLDDDYDSLDNWDDDDQENAENHIDDDDYGYFQ